MFIILLSSLVVAEITININVSPTFSIGETVSFDYEMRSDLTQQIEYYAHSICNNAPVSMFQKKIVQLNDNQSYKANYTDITISDQIAPQTCTAYVRIMSPFQQIEMKNFTIKTNPSFDFKIKLDKKVFIKNENIDLDYESDVSGLDVYAILIYPDKKSKSITFSHQFKANQIGTYTLEVTASKEGYKTITKKEMFGVIKSEANIGGEIIGKEKDESKNLFSNFTTKIKAGDKKYLFFVLIILLAVLFLVFLVIILFIKRKDREIAY
ncbi:MAG: hypothetical protein KKF67_03065 [Nanoarchaeota archaeon]|nr:hypothetical protein [Nanoarchaeota archaeon]